MNLTTPSDRADPVPGNGTLSAYHSKDQRCPPRPFPPHPDPPIRDRSRKGGETWNDPSPRLRCLIQPNSVFHSIFPGVTHRRPPQSKPQPQPGSPGFARISRCTARCSVQQTVHPATNPFASNKNQRGIQSFRVSSLPCRPASPGKRGGSGVPPFPGRGLESNMHTAAGQRPRASIKEARTPDQPRLTQPQIHNPIRRPSSFLLYPALRNH